MTVSELTIKIKNRIWRKYIKDIFYHQRVITPPFLQNLNYSNNNQKKVLICYLTTIQFFEWDHYSKGRTQPYEILSMIKVFSELGYCIDVIGSYDIKSIDYVKVKTYDIIFGFGETFYQLTQLQPKAVSVLYMTENHPLISYREEQKRLVYFQSRHRKGVKISRSGSFYTLVHLEKLYSHVITMSEIAPFEPLYKKPYSIFPTGIINPNFKNKIKNHQSSRKNFLWLGSDDAIHKGLDLLIDIFSQRQDIVLHIGGLSDKDKKILNIPKRENIINYGYIDVKSNLFLEIIENCSYSILPSCSEGCATSITTSMLHALIPIVIKDTGFNRLGENAIFLKDYKIDYIDSVLTKLSREDPDRLSLFSKKVFDFAHKKFLIQTFEKNFKTIMNDILETND